MSNESMLEMLCLGMILDDTVRVKAMPREEWQPLYDRWKKLSDMLIKETLINQK